MISFLWVRKLSRTISFFIILIAFIVVGVSLRAELLQPASATDLSLGASMGGNGDSGSIIMSRNGRFVLFASTANNLLLATNNQPMRSSFPARFNVFLRDRTNATTTLVSANMTGVSGGNGDSIPSDISSNGQLILFESGASDLVGNDTNNFTDIFVRNVATSTTILVSVSTNGGNDNGDSRSAVITPDGRYVAFVSAASNLVQNDTNGIPDVFVRDLLFGTTVLASPGAIAMNSSSSSEAPEISEDGRYVVFYSTATNVVPGVVIPSAIYVRDLFLSSTIRVSAAAHSILLSVTGNSNAVCWNHAISSNGKLIAYCASNPNQSSGLMLRYNIDGGVTHIAHTNAIMPTGSREDLRTLDITPDGRFIAFLANSRTNAALTGTVPSVAVWDGNSLTTAIASLNLTNGVATGPFGSPALFDFPAISANGRYVSFLSTATNLTTNLFDFGHHVYVRDLQLNQTRQADVDTNGNLFDLLPFVAPRLSSNGQFIAFASLDPHLVGQNSRRDHQIYMRNQLTNTVELISVRHHALASATPNGASPFSNWSVNGNGRYVAFSSIGSDLAPNDNNFNRDIFVRDLLNQTNILASVRTNGFSAGGMSFEPAISGDGRYVAFTSTANNFFPNDNNQMRDVFVCDLQTRVVTLASIAMNGTSVGNGPSYSPFLSAEGRYLFYASKASNLASGSFVSGSENLFWRDLLTSNTVALTTAGITNVSISPDGRFAAYKTSSANNTLYLWDSFVGARVYTNNSFPGIVSAISPDGNRLAYTLSGQLQILTRNPNTNWIVGALPSVSRAGVKFSGDGRFLTYASSNNQGFTDANGTFDVYLYELSTRTKTLVSRAYGAANAASSASDSPDVSYDGRFVTYRSFATNIVLNDTNGVGDVYIYDRFSNENSLLSQNSDGFSGNNRSMAPAFSRDGKTLVFTSWAADLVSNDFNRGSDLFSFSFLYVTITRNAGEPPLITWPATPGQTYQAQFKNNVDDPDWFPVNGTIVFTDKQASIQDISPNAEHRIYRVVGF